MVVFSQKGDTRGLGTANRPWSSIAFSQPTPWRHEAKAGGSSFKTERCFHTACHHTVGLCHRILSVPATASKRGRKKSWKENNLNSIACRDTNSGPGGPLDPQGWGGEVGKVLQWVPPVLALLPWHLWLVGTGCGVRWTFGLTKGDCSSMTSSLTRWGQLSLSHRMKVTLWLQPGKRAVLSPLSPAAWPLAQHTWSLLTWDVFAWSSPDSQSPKSSKI